MADAEQAFKAYWASTVHPFISDDFERLLSTTPQRIADKKNKPGRDRIDEKLTGILADVKEKGERRNAFLNLA